MVAGLLSRDGLLFADDSPFLLRDEFAAGISGAWTEADSGSNVTAPVNGRLRFSGGSNAWDGNALASASSYARSRIGLFAALVRARGFGDTSALVGLNAASLPSDPGSNGIGLYFDGAGAAARFRLKVSGGSVILSESFRVRSVDYVVVVVPRPSGGYLVAVSGGQYGTWPTATLIWSTSGGTSDPLYAVLANYAGGCDVDWARLLKASKAPASYTTQYGLANASDTFTGADSATSMGAAYSVAVASGVFGISSNQAYCVSTSGLVGRFRTDGSADGMVECDITVPSDWNGSNAWFGLIVRGQDANNFLRFTNNNANSITLQTWVGGSFGAGIASTAKTWVAGQTYHWRVKFKGNRYLITIDDTDIFGGEQVDSNSRFLTATGFGVYCNAGGSRTGLRWDNLVSWPLQITLPTVIGAPPSVPVGTGSATLSDTMTDVDGTAITAHTLDTGGNWSLLTAPASGTVQITGNQAQCSAAGQGYLVGKDYGAVDCEVKCSITTGTTPAAGKDWFPLVFLRGTDDQNHVYARFLYQNNSPEIEVWEVVAGSPTLIAYVNLGAGNLAASTQYVLYLAAKGSEVAAYMDTAINGISITKELMAQGTTSVLTGTKVGFGVSGSANTVGTPKFDTFEARAAA